MSFKEVMFVTAVLLVVAVQPVIAATTQNLDILSIREDYFYNYDFLSTTASGTNVDWPVTMLFYNNAEIDKVKNIFFGSTILANKMYEKLDDGVGWVWDSDRGTKGVSSSPTCTCWLHMRLYADSDDRMYNLDWGYYVLGTTHYDDFPDEDWSGFSESAEEEFASLARDEGYAVSEDSMYFYNYEPLRIENGNHYWDNNGYVTTVNVP